MIENPIDTAERMTLQGIRYAARGADFLLQTAPVYIPRFARRIREIVSGNRRRSLLMASLAGAVVGSCAESEAVGVATDAFLFAAILGPNVISRLRRRF